MDVLTSHERSMKLPVAMHVEHLRPLNIKEAFQKTVIATTIIRFIPFLQNLLHHLGPHATTKLLLPIYSNKR